MTSENDISGSIRTFDWTELPNTWKFELLGNVSTVRRGSSPRPAGDPRYFGGTIPWFKIGDATHTGSRFLQQTEEFVNEEGAKYSVRIRPGSLIVANSGVSLGFAVITAVEGCIHDGWLLFENLKGADRDYLYYCINYLTPRIRRMADGTTQPNLNTGIARRLLLPLPALPEQRAIAGVLGALDDKIELNRRMNETLEALAQTLFQKMRDEGGGKPGKIEDLCTLSRETINPGEFPDETFDHYSIPAFDEGRLPKPETGQSIKSSKFLVPTNAAMISKLNPRIPRIWLPDVSTDLRSVASTEFLIGIPKPGISREWLYGLFASQAFLDVFATMITGTSGSHQRVKPEYLLAMDMEFPPAEAIQHYTEAAAPLHRRFALNLQESRTLAALRDALLPKLLSGAVRVKESPL